MRKTRSLMPIWFLLRMQRLLLRGMMVPLSLTRDELINKRIIRIPLLFLSFIDLVIVLILEVVTLYRCTDQMDSNRNALTMLVPLNSLYGRRDIIATKVLSLGLKLPSLLKNIINHMPYSVNKLLRDLIHDIMYLHVQLLSNKRESH